MKQTWRWFGPADEISISEIRMTGAEGIVTALHHIPTGEVWSVEDIRTRQEQVARPDGIPSGLSWEVVESLSISEDIKSQSGNFKEHFSNYRQNLTNIAECGISTVCYNFMPVLDWTRTELAAPIKNGGTAMCFDLLDFAVFDLLILEREAASDDYSNEFIAMARNRVGDLDDEARRFLTKNIVAGLPGANENWTIETLRRHLTRYHGLGRQQLQSNLVDFLSEVVPTAEKLGIRLCCHPDDPPFPLLGLPRIMSSQSDYRYIMQQVDSAANGITFCTGSLGVAPDFDPVEFVEQLGGRVHFVHLRNTHRHAPNDRERCSFHESEHLTGDTDMVRTIKALLDEEGRRKGKGREDSNIPMRPDHGHALAGDLDRPMMPGYPLVGRLRGLAELRGVMAGLLVDCSDSVHR